MADFGYTINQGGIWFDTGSSITADLRIDDTTPRSSMPNITTRVVQLKAGWVGQVVVNGKIVWESKPKVQRSKVNGAPSGEALAWRAAKRRIDRKLAELLG